METANFITDTWAKKPDKIFVFPFLREIYINERGHYNRLSKYVNRAVLNSEPAFQLMARDHSVQYLADKNLLDIYDFRYADGNMVREPGDIHRFIRYLKYTLFSDYRHKTENNTLNLCIITHAGVLYDFAKSMHQNENVILQNNSGCIVKLAESRDALEIKSVIPIHADYIDYDISDTETERVKYYCPSKRCKSYCRDSKNWWRKDVKMNKCNTEFTCTNDIINILESNPNMKIAYGKKNFCLFKPNLTTDEYKKWFIDFENNDNEFVIHLFDEDLCT